MAGDIKVKRSVMEKVIAICGIAVVAVSFAFFSSPYTAFLVFTALLLVWASYYAHFNRSHMSEMCCMMSGMAFGMIGGFFIGVIAGLATADFLAGMVAGTVAGVAFGIPIGKLGGPLARMEGVMAGPMGGIMGGMTGVMVRFYNVQLFMLFFAVVVLFTVWEMVRVIQGQAGRMSRNFMYIGILLSLLAFSASIANNYGTGSTGLAFAKEEAAAVPSGGVQEVTIKMQAFDYSPGVITVKKGVPVKLNLEASANAGCTRSIVFPDFNIRKLVPKGGKAAVEFTPTKAGTYQFSCSMGMAGGTLIVQ